MADDDPNTIDFGDSPDRSPSFDSPDNEPAWDADDPRRQHDQFAPPAEPCECYCLHCNRVFMSDGMWFQKVVGDPNGFEGFWMCPTPNCGGAGFTFDIFPTDPNHPANAGWSYDDDDAEYSEEEFEPMLEEDADAAEWDPEEPMYKSAAENDDDIRLKTRGASSSSAPGGVTICWPLAFFLIMARTCSR